MARFYLFEMKGKNKMVSALFGSPRDNRRVKAPDLGIRKYMRQGPRERERER